MRRILIILACLLTSYACSKSQQNASQKEPTNVKLPKETIVRTDTLITFENVEVGKMPADWSNQYTGRGKLGRWEVRLDGDNKVLAQVSKENFGYHFNLAVWEKSSYQDLELTVKFKGVEGKEDRGGGPVWRYQNADNYYIARANPLENNFRVYKVVDGNRRQLASARLRVTSGEWHTIRILMQGNHIECYYDGKKYLDVKDDTFKQSGKIGLWTKADAVTYFDDLKVVTLK